MTIRGETHLHRRERSHPVRRDHNGDAQLFVLPKALDVPGACLLPCVRRPPVRVAKGVVYHEDVLRENAVPVFENGHACANVVLLHLPVIRRSLRRLGRLAEGLLHLREHVACEAVPAALELARIWLAREVKKVRADL